MSNPKSLRKSLGAILVIVFLAGCGAPAPAPMIPSPPPPPPTDSAPPSRGENGLFRFVRTVQVSPDGVFKTGDFVRVNYVPATDRLAVTFVTRGFLQPTGDCEEKGLAYRGYTLNMDATGESGLLFCGLLLDIGSLMVDSTYYFVMMDAEGAGGSVAWRIIQYDAVSWKRTREIFFSLHGANEPELRKNSDPMLAFVNGQLDISGGYQPGGTGPATATHHQFFTRDLEFLGERILADEPNVEGSQMIFLDGIYYFVTAEDFLGDVVLMQYDRDWKYLGRKTLIKQAHFSTGLAFDGERFYLAYVDTSHRTETGATFRLFLNIRLATFDRDWNLLDDVAVTTFTPEDNRQPGRPWLLLHGNRLYVSYDVSTGDYLSGSDAVLATMQGHVSVYEVTQQP